MVQPWRLYSVRYFTSAFSEADHHCIFGLCTAVYSGRWSCEVPPDTFVSFFFKKKKKHPFPSSSITASSYAGPGPPGQLLDPTLRPLELLPSFFFLAYVDSWPTQLHPGALFVEVVNFLDHGGFGDIVATFWSHTDPSRNVAGNTVENGLTDRRWSRESVRDRMVCSLRILGPMLSGVGHEALLKSAHFLNLSGSIVQ